MIKVFSSATALFEYWLWNAEVARVCEVAKTKIPNSYFEKMIGKARLKRKSGLAEFLLKLFVQRLITKVPKSNLHIISHLFFSA